MKQCKVCGVELTPEVRDRRYLRCKEHGLIERRAKRVRTPRLVKIPTCNVCGVLLTSENRHRGRRLCREHGKEDATSSARRIRTSPEGNKRRREYLHATRAKTIFHSARLRARLRGIAFEIEESDVVIPTHCPVFNIPLDSSDRNHAPTLDRFENSKGYTPDNVRVISFRANRLKAEMDLADIELLYAYMRGEQ